MIPHKIRTSIKFVMSSPASLETFGVQKYTNCLGDKQRHILNFEPTQYYKNLQYDNTWPFFVSVFMRRKCLKFMQTITSTSPEAARIPWICHWGWVFSGFYLCFLGFFVFVFCRSVPGDNRAVWWFGRCCEQCRSTVGERVLEDCHHGQYGTVTLYDSFFITLI